MDQKAETPTSNPKLSNQGLKDLLNQPDFNQLLENARAYKTQVEAEEQAQNPPPIENIAEIPPTKPKAISRRNFLTGLAGATALAAAGGYWAYKLFDTAPQTPKKDSVTEAAEEEETKPVEIFPTPNPYFGFRNDIPELMVWAKRAGASCVRIDGDRVDLKQPDVLNEAKRLDLDILYVFHPTKPLSASEVDTQLEAIFNSGANITLEIGNEPDDVTVPRWQNHDLDSFARFVALVFERMRQLKSSGVIPSEAKAIVGALTNQKNTDKFISSLTRAGISDFKNLTFAVHAYDSPEDVRYRTNLVKKATGGEVMITEIGTNNVAANNQPIMKSVDTISQMYTAAREFTNNPIYIHQLPYTERDPITGQGYGYVEMNGTPLASFDKLKENIEQVEEQKSSQKKNPAVPVSI